MIAKECPLCKGKPRTRKWGTMTLVHCSSPDCWFGARADMPIRIWNSLQPASPSKDKIFDAAVKWFRSDQGKGRDKAIANLVHAVYRHFNKGKKK